MITSLQTFFAEPWSPAQCDTTIRIVSLGFFIAVSCGLVGVYLILRRMALVGDAISHSVLPGIVLAAIITHSLSGPFITLGAVAAGVLTTVLIEWIHRESRIKQDAAIGIAFTTLFAIGVVMVSFKTSDVHIDADCILFGKIAAVATDPSGGLRKIAFAGGIALATIALIVALYKELLVASFDATLARSMGIRARWIHYGLMVWLSVVVVTAFEAVGSIMVVAFLIIPGATALLLRTRLWQVMLLTVLHAALSAVLGHHVGLALNVSSPPAMVVTGFALFLLAWLFSPGQGLIPRALHRGRITPPLDPADAARFASPDGDATRS